MANMVNHQETQHVKSKRTEVELVYSHLKKLNTPMGKLGGYKEAYQSAGARRHARSR